MTEHEHSHEHTHTHTHSHTHDGVEHTHEHSHVHSHEHSHENGEDHQHTHAHEHAHEHTHSHGCEGIHCGEGINCAECGHEHVSPREELMALMKYMVNHNTAHANELAELAKQLQTMGENTAYEQVMQAVSDFEKGNLRLSTVLSALDA